MPAHNVTISATFIESDPGIGSGTQADPFELTNRVWKNGAISAGVTELWYSFPVSSGATYYVWLNDIQVYEGKTLDAKVSAVHSNGTSLFVNADYVWFEPETITPTSDGTVYLKVEPWLPGNIGTFGIVYSTRDIRPNIGNPGPLVMPIVSAHIYPWLAIGTSWVSVQGAEWYNIYRSTSVNGPYTKIGEGGSSLQYQDEDVVFGDTYYYKVSAENSYGESPQSAPVSATAGAVTITPLTLGVWTGTIEMTPNSEHWYSLEIDETWGTYFVYESEVGDPYYWSVTYDLYKNDGTPVQNSTNIYYAAGTYASSIGLGTAYLRVYPNENLTGAAVNYRLVYTLGSGKPVIDPDLTGAVTITGNAVVKQTLTANITNLDGDGNVSYQWNRVAAAGGGSTPINGANSSSYQLQAADEGNTITVTVMRTGYSGSVTSAAIGPIAPAPQGTATFSISFAQIIDATIDELVVPQKISISGDNGPETVTLTLDGQYDTVNWYITGANVSGTGPEFILDAANTFYNTVGPHLLTVLVWKDGVPYNKTIRFTVAE
jgi:hypothetical protein